ncbi:MAG: O-antigen ligase family protein, partial [Acidimicrobiales bacterium]
ARPSLPAWPPWVWIWLAADALIFVLRAADVLQSIPLCVFLCAVAGALCFSFSRLAEFGPAHPLLRARQLVLVAVVVSMPSLFDPSTVDVDDLPRLVLLVVAATALVALWAIDATAHGWRPRRLANGFQWTLAAIVVWFGVTTLTSVELRTSFLGRTGTYEGFLLVAALAVIACALAESFTARALPALSAIVVAAVTPALVYGCIQVYGFDVRKGTSIDFVQWNSAFHNVFATFGNPNHFGGFLVTVLPFGVVSAVLARRTHQRVILWAWVAVVLVLILQTAARGAWLGAIVGGAILVAGFLPRLRTSGRTAALVAAGAIVVAVALIAGGSRFLGAKAAALLQFGSGSSVSQRYGYWSAALHLGLHHPLVGTGPDTYAVTYAQYQSASLAKVLGSSFFVNGAHNIFLSWLADEGIPGFLLIVVLFLSALAWGIKAWRALRARAAPPAQDDSPGPVSDDVRRYLVAALVASLCAYFVQACFDVEQVGTLFTMFMVIGFLGIVGRGLWSTPTLLRHPFATGAEADADADVPAEEDDPHYPVRQVRVGSYGRSARRAQSDLRRQGAVLLVGALGLTAVALTFWRTDAMWRADHDARTGTQATVTEATTLNPWEPSYFSTLGQAAAESFARTPDASDALTLIQDSVSYLRQAAALDGANSYILQQYGESLTAEAKKENSSAVLTTAVDVLRRARHENPYNTALPGLIDKAQAALPGG